MAAFRFVNFLMILAALGASAFAAYVFFGRTEIDAVDKRLSVHEQKIAEESKSAEAGDVNAQFRVGRLYRYGEGRTRDLKSARKWFANAARAGHAGAQYELGKMYALGEGVGQNFHRAAEWYGLSARIGFHRSAQYAMGELAYFGRGVDLDYVDAHDWFMKAAKRNHPLAQFYLGEIYEKGRGVEPDRIEALKWYTLSMRKPAEISALGLGKPPEAILESLKTRMNRSQLDAAQGLVDAWKP